MNELTNENDNINTSCPICLNNIIENNNSAITPCGHKFCFNCIIESLQTTYTCPLCRTILLEHIENDNENTVNLSFKEQIILYFKRIYNDGFTQKELLYAIVLLLSYQNYKLLKYNIILSYYYISC